MAFDDMLTRDLVLRVVADAGYAYRIDATGDIRLEVGRHDGQDLTFLISDSALHSQTLQLKCFCPVLFDGGKRSELQEFCNSWHLHFRLPRATIRTIDARSDLWLALDHVVFCENGVSYPLVQQALVRFLAACGDFWHEADQRFV